MNHSLKNTIPLEERPRERCLETGPACLSLRECLALILGSGPAGSGCLGVANEILSRPGKGMSSSGEEAAFFTSMEISSKALLQDIPGLGPAGKAKVLAAFEIGRRYALFRNRIAYPELRKNTFPELAIRALKTISQKQRDDPQEWFGFVPILRSGSMGDFCLVDKGTRTHVNLDSAELFARILALRPRGLFLFHNHPSGDTIPSLQDLELTERIERLSREFHIQLLGHWLVTSQSERWIPASAAQDRLD